MNQTNKQFKKPTTIFPADKLKNLATALVDFNASVTGNKSDVDAKRNAIINVLRTNGCEDIAGYMMHNNKWENFKEELENSNFTHDFRCAIIFAQYDKLLKDKDDSWPYRIEKWRNHIAMLPIKAFKDSPEKDYKVNSNPTTQMDKVITLAARYGVPVTKESGEGEKDALLSIKKIGYKQTAGKELKTLSADGESLAPVGEKGEKGVCTIINAYDMFVGYNEVNTILNNIKNLGLLEKPLHSELLANIQNSLDKLIYNRYGVVNTMLKKLSKVDANGNIQTSAPGLLYGTNDTHYKDAITDCEKVYANLSVARDSAITLLIKASEEILKDPLSQKAPNLKAIVDALKKANLRRTAEEDYRSLTLGDKEVLKESYATTLHNLFKEEQEAIKELVASLGKVIEAKKEVINTQPFHYTSPILDPAHIGIGYHHNTRVGEFGNTSNATKLSSHIKYLVDNPKVENNLLLYSVLAQDPGTKQIFLFGYEKDQEIINEAINKEAVNDHLVNERFRILCTKRNKFYSEEQKTTIAEKALNRASKMTENGVERDLLNDMKEVCGAEGDFGKIFKQLFLTYQANDGMLDNDKNLGENRANRMISIINYTLLQYGVQVSGPEELARKSRAMYTLFTLLSARFQKTCQVVLGVEPRMIDFTFEDIAVAIKSCGPKQPANQPLAPSDPKNDWKTSFKDEPIEAQLSTIAKFDNIQLRDEKTIDKNHKSKLSDIYKVSEFKLYQRHVSPDRKKIATNIEKRDKNNKPIGPIEQEENAKKHFNWGVSVRER